MLIAGMSSSPQSSSQHNNLELDTATVRASGLNGVCVTRYMQPPMIAAVYAYSKSFVALSVVLFIQCV